MIDFLINNWDAVSSLFLSIVAIAIAIISSRETSKQAKVQIAELEKLTDTSIQNTDKQINEIKLMTKKASDSAIQHLLSMKELACSIINQSILNLEYDIESSLEEKSDMNLEHKERLEKLQMAREEANQEPPEPIYLYRTEEELREYYLRREELLDNRIRNLEIIRKKLCDLLDKLEKEREEIDIPDVNRHKRIDLFY